MIALIPSEINNYYYHQLPSDFHLPFSSQLILKLIIINFNVKKEKTLYNYTIELKGGLK
jgi:hypothetical protein